VDAWPHATPALHQQKSIVSEGLKTLDSAGLRWTLLELQEYRHLRRTQAVNKGDPGDLRDALPEWGGSSLSRDLPGRSWAH